MYSLAPLKITSPSILNGVRLIKISRAFKLQQLLPLTQFALQQYYKGFFLDSQAPSTPLFTIFSGTAFSTLYIQKTLKLRLNFYNILAAQYTGYSFRRGVAQHALDHSFFNKEVQCLSRQILNTFYLYYLTLQANAFRLLQRF